MFRPLASLTGLVLLVEPDLALARQIVEAIEIAGLSTLHCSDARLATELATEERPDLVITELLMPGVDGLSLFVQFQRQGLGLPFIVLSTRSNAIDRIIGLRLGIADWMNKPFDLDELVARTQAILRRVSSPAAVGRSRQSAPA